MEDKCQRFVSKVECSSNFYDSGGVLCGGCVIFLPLDGSKD